MEETIDLGLNVRKLIMTKPEIVKAPFERSRNYTKAEELWKHLESKDYDLFKIDKNIKSIEKDYLLSSSFRDELLELHRQYLNYIKRTSPHIWDLRYNKASPRMGSNK